MRVPSYSGVHTYKRGSYGLCEDAHGSLTFMSLILQATDVFSCFYCPVHFRRIVI